MSFASIVVAVTLAMIAPYATPRHAVPIYPRPPNAVRFAVSQNATMYVFRGFVISMPAGSLFNIVLRNGRVMRVNATMAIARQQSSGSFFIGRPLMLLGYLDRASVLHATSVERTEDLIREWPPDGLYIPPVYHR